MKLYLFAQTGAYGEFIEIVSAKDAEQAWNVSKARTNGWYNDPQELATTQIPSTIFEGGGDNG